MAERKCFIIMPIITPRDLISYYKDDVQHFLHIMSLLFLPAITKAGFVPISPISQDSETIHSEILSVIESADLVLCDISIHNPNVFFELGIRTALNKPVCLVKDDITENVPFDTHINCHTYLSNFSAWTIEKEIERLASYIMDSFSISNNSNSLWKYFDFKSYATHKRKLVRNRKKLTI
jgi:nucleoside 2-deoxyribosyltransferase